MVWRQCVGRRCWDPFCGAAVIASRGCVRVGKDCEVWVFTVCWKTFSIILKKDWGVVKRYRVVIHETKAFAQLGSNWTVSVSSDELKQFHYPQLAINQWVLLSEIGIQCVLCYSLKLGLLVREMTSAMVAWSHSSKDFIISFDKVATEGSNFLKHNFEIGIHCDSVYVNFLWTVKQFTFIDKKICKKSMSKIHMCAFK